MKQSRQIEEKIIARAAMVGMLPGPAVLTMFVVAIASFFGYNGLPEIG
jgi:hypothetical protein